MRRSRALEFLLIVVMAISSVASFLTYGSVQQMHSEILDVLAEGKEDPQQTGADGTQGSSANEQTGTDMQTHPAKAVLKCDPSLRLEEEEIVGETLARFVIGQDQKRKLDLDGDGEEDTVTCERDEEQRIAVDMDFANKEHGAFSLYFLENGESWARVMSLDLGDGTRTLLIAEPEKGDGSGERRMLVTGMRLTEGGYALFPSDSDLGEPLKFTGSMEEDTVAYIEAEATDSAGRFYWEAGALDGQVKKGDTIRSGYIWDLSYREKADGQGYYLEYWQEMFAGEGVLLGYAVTVAEVDAPAGTEQVLEQYFVPLQDGRMMYSGGSALAFAEEEIIGTELVSLCAGIGETRRADLDGDGETDDFLCDVDEEGNIYAQMKFSMKGLVGHTARFVMEGAQRIRLLSLDLGDGNRTLVIGAQRQDEAEGRSLIVMGLRLVDGEYVIFPEENQLGKSMEFAGRMETDTVARIDLSEMGEEQKITLENSLFDGQVKKGDTILFDGICEVSFQKKQNGGEYDLKYWQQGRTENGVLVGYGVTVAEIDPQAGTRKVISQFFVPQASGTETT